MIDPGSTRNAQFGTGVFVCSKPLQFLICASIVRLYGVRDAEIFVVTRTLADPDGFIGFVNSSEYGRLFRRVHVRSNYQQVVSDTKALEYDSLFVEDDRVSFYWLFAPLKTKQMAVFEEGVATYRDDYRKKLTGLRKVKWLALSVLTGCGMQFGDGRATDFVMVQHPEVYRSLNPGNAHKPLPIPAFVDELAHYRTDWESVIRSAGIDSPERTSRAALILGTKGGAPTDKLREIAGAYDEVYYKAHPHDGAVDYSVPLHVIRGSWVPAEVYIDYLASHCRTLCVYHFSSTAYMNCLGKHENVEFVDLLGAQGYGQVYDRLERLAHQKRA